jgi:chemotaxis protein methyltransferase CheR
VLQLDPRVLLEGHPGSQASNEAPSHWDLPELSVSPALFARFQRLIYSETGIWLSESKTALLCGRLARRLRALELSSMRDYYHMVADADQGEERIHMIDAITTNETRFFREPKHFEYLNSTIFPIWRRTADQGLRSRRIRIWSAGCSSGEEPYSLAMVFAENLPQSEGWDVRIVATDISTRVLELAREGIYRIGASPDIPADLLRRFMLKGHDEYEGKMKVIRELREMVDFQRLNLADEFYPFRENFEMIFCRNVLIYFDTPSKTKVVEKLIRNLSPQGLLFIGHAENLHGVARGLQSVAPTVYLQGASKSTGTPLNGNS